MKTICIQIGNSDDELSQLEWSAFIHNIHSVIEKNATEIHFTGFSIPTAVWQNACWVIAVSNDVDIANFQEELIDVKQAFRQNSIAWLEGEAEFI